MKYYDDDTDHRRPYLEPESEWERDALRDSRAIQVTCIVRAETLRGWGLDTLLHYREMLVSGVGLGLIVATFLTVLGLCLLPFAWFVNVVLF